MQHILIEELPIHDNWYQSVVKSMLVGFPLPFIQTPIMSKKMVSVECFDTIDATIENLKGIVDAVRNIKNEEIPKLFQ